MIIYGTKSKQLAAELLNDKCTSCGTQHSTDMHVFQKYAHVYWVPMFPLGKTAVSQCDHCKLILKHNEMPASLKSSYEDVKSRTKTPIWMFAGLAIIGVLIAIGAIASSNDDKRNIQLVSAAQPGDFYEVKLNYKSYTLYKVDQVKGDSVYVRMLDYETNKQSGLSDLKKKSDHDYAEETVGYSVKELKKMVEDGDIVDVDR